MHLFIIIFVVNFDPKGDFVVEKVTFVQKAMLILFKKQCALNLKSFSVMDSTSTFPPVIYGKYIQYTIQKLL